MHKLLFVFFGLSFLLGCVGGEEEDSLLRITNDANENFRITQIRFLGYASNYLNIQYGESLTFDLSDGLSLGSSNMNIDITYTCDSQDWSSTFAINLNEGSTSSFDFVKCSSTADDCRVFVLNKETAKNFTYLGAMETGSLTKLQKAMGHSSINVSLTYLRGLEIAELKEEDMPLV